MQQRFIPFILVAGFLIVTLIGVFAFTSSPDDNGAPGQEAVLSVSSTVGATDTSQSETQNETKDTKISDEESAQTTGDIVIPAPVLKAEEADQAETASDADLSLANEESEAEPTFAITVARVNPDGSSLFAGVAEADATIQLQDGKILLDETTSDANGEWVSIPAEKLSAGPHIIILTMRTKDGRIATANMSLIVEIAATKTDKPLVALVPQDDTNAPILLQSPDADADIEVIEEDVAEIAVPATVPAISIQSLSLSSTDRLRVRGRFSAGQSISGALGDKPLMETSMSDEGRWSALVDVSGLSSEPETLEIVLHDGSGTVVARTGLALDKNNINRGLNDNEMVVVQKGDALWRIAYRTYGKGVRYVEIVRRNQDQISDPDMIFPNQIFVLPN